MRQSLEHGMTWEKMFLHLEKRVTYTCEKDEKVIMKAVMWSTALCGCEFWTLRLKDIKKVEA